MKQLLARLTNCERYEPWMDNAYCTLLDEAWYREQYPHLLLEGMSPLAHYSCYGVTLGCDPSPYFSTKSYLEDNPQVAESGENPLWHYAYKGRALGCRIRMSTLADKALLRGVLANQSAKKLEAKLWSGFSKDVYPLLKRRLASPLHKEADRADAAWALARWDAFYKNYASALRYLLLRQKIDQRSTFDKVQVLLLSECLVRLAQESDAYESLQSARRVLGKQDVDLLLGLSNVWSSSQEQEAVDQRLSLINQILSQSGFSSLALRQHKEPFSIFNVASNAPKATGADRIKVSVLMPAYNAGAQIELALRSLQQQSWDSLEVLVADDCSTDDTSERVAAIAQQDPRIKLITLEKNGGAYAARNRALAQATGDVITVHDSDDWSHPQKLEVQVRYLIENPETIATITDWARAREDLYFTGTFRAHGALTSENTSSLMFRSQAVGALGGWDLARTSADTEYMLRLKRLYGDESVVRLHLGVPLAFALDQETSLTRTPVTHAKTLFFGARREYREAAIVWHESAADQELYVPPEGGPRPFPIPAVMRPKRDAAAAEYDVVVIADFNLSGGAYISTMNYVNAAIQLGKRVALFHWRRADLDVQAALKHELRLRAQAGDFDILAAGERVRSDLVLVGYPVVLNYVLDSLPQIQTQRFAILVNQMASRLTTGEDPQYNPQCIHQNVRDLFGVEALWVPISGLVQRLMREDPRYPEPHADIWNPLLDVDNWCRLQVRWRGGERTQPVLGRHARDHYTKWPSTAGALADAYCVGHACEVRLLGGADHALRLLGDTPGNWTVYDFADSSYEFLQDLDFFIHYPHEQYIEEFGRAVLEAMGLGIPAILPPVFKETFGEYAHYATPEGVWPLIQRLWANQHEYEKAAELGLKFVRDCADYSVLAQRLKQLG